MGYFGERDPVTTLPQGFGAQIANGTVVRVGAQGQCGVWEAGRLIEARPVWAGYLVGAPIGESAAASLIHHARSLSP